MNYILDSGVFIEAAKRYYAFDIVPGYWIRLTEHAGTGRTLSVDHVKYELEKGNDHLATWAHDNFADAFIRSDAEAVQQAYGNIISWVVGQAQFTDAAKEDFARGADGWVIAACKVMNRVVVTEEVPNRDIKRRVPIPNVCVQFQVEWCNTFRMLRELGIRFN